MPEFAEKINFLIIKCEYVKILPWVKTNSLGDRTCIFGMCCYSDSSNIALQKQFAVVIYLVKGGNTYTVMMAPVLKTKYLQARNMQELKQGYAKLCLSSL